MRSEIRLVEDIEDALETEVPEWHLSGSMSGALVIGLRLLLLLGSILV